MIDAWWAALRCRVLSTFTPQRRSLRCLTSESLEPREVLNGDFLWAAAVGVGSEGASAAVSATDADAQGNLYVTGSFSGTVDLDPGPGTSVLTSAGSEDAYVIKLDAGGRLLWSARFGGTASCHAADLAVDEDGNLVIVGTFSGTVDFDPGSTTDNLVGDQDIFVVKLDSGGRLIWSRKLGAAGQETTPTVAVDGGRNVIVGGLFEGTVDFDPGAGVAALTSAGSHDVFVVKLDSNGTHSWSGRFGSAGTDACSDVAVDLDGSVLIAGTFQSTVDFDPGPGSAPLTANGFSGFVVKLNSGGAFTWARAMTGPNSSINCTGVAVDTAGNVFIVGDFDHTIDLNPNGGTDFQTAVGAIDVFVVKVSSSGTYAWGRTWGGSFGAQVTGDGVAADRAGNVTVVGSLVGTADFDPSSGVAPLTSVGGTDVFAAQLTADGNFAWANQFGGSRFDYGFTVDFDAFGDAILGGTFVESGDFDPGPATLTLQTSFAAGFLVRLSGESASGSPTFADRSLVAYLKAPAGTVVSTLQATPFTPGQTLNYRIVGGDTGAFSLDTTTGVLTIADPKKLSGAAMSLIVRAFESGAPARRDDAVVTIRLATTNQAPTFTITDAGAAPVAVVSNRAALVIDEGAPNGGTADGLLVATILAADVDEPGSVLAAMLADPTGAFAYDAFTGRLTVADASKLNFEKSKKATLSFKVGDHGIPGSTTTKTTTLTLTVNLRDVNEAPTITSAPSFTVAENNRAKKFVGAVKAVDPDKTAPNKTLTYALISLTDDTNQAVAPEMFAIDAGGKITLPTANVLNYEASTFYTLVVGASDGGAGNLSAVQTIRIDVEDLNEAPLIRLIGPGLNATTELTIAENAPNGTLLGYLQLHDPDVSRGETLTLSVAASLRGAIAVGPLDSAGRAAVTVLDSAQLDFEKIRGGVFSLTASATDTGFVNNFNKKLPKLTTKARLNVRVQDVGE